MRAHALHLNLAEGRDTKLSLISVVRDLPDGSFVMSSETTASNEDTLPLPTPSPDLAAVVLSFGEENGENNKPMSTTPDRSQNQSSVSTLSVSTTTLNPPLQQARADTTSGFHLSYQARHPVEPYKYITRRDERTDAVAFECTVCHGFYKHRKSLNKHWKDKHPNVTAEMVAPRIETALAQLPPLRDLTSATANAQIQPTQPHSRLSLRRSPVNAPTQTPKRRRSELPQPSSAHVFPSSTPIQPTPSDPDQPLDLSTRPTRDAEILPTPNQLSVPDVADSSLTKSAVATSNRAAAITLLQASLSALAKEPSDVQSLRDASYGTRALLFATGSLLFHEARPDPSELIVPTNGVSSTSSHGANVADRKRVEGGPLHCPLCPFTARWQSEVKAHVVNHSNHRLFGCLHCEYRAKWKYDVVKHVDKCPNAPRQRQGGKDDVIYFPPPPGDILGDFFPTAAQVSGTGGSADPLANGATSVDENSNSNGSDSTKPPGSSKDESSDPEEEKPLTIVEDSPQ